MNQKVELENQSNPSVASPSIRLPNRATLLEENPSKSDPDDMVPKASEKLGYKLSPEKQEMQIVLSMASGLSQHQQSNEAAIEKSKESDLRQSILSVAQNQCSKDIDPIEEVARQFQQPSLSQPQVMQAPEVQFQTKRSFPTAIQFLCSVIIRLLQKDNQDDKQIQKLKEQLKGYVTINKTLLQKAKMQMNIIKEFSLPVHEIPLENVNTLDQQSIRLMLYQLVSADLDQLDREYILSRFILYIEAESNFSRYQLEQKIMIALLNNLSIHRTFNFKTLDEFTIQEDHLQTFKIIQNSTLIKTYLNSVNQIPFKEFTIMEGLNKAFDKIRISPLRTMNMKTDIFCYIDTKGSVILNAKYPIDDIVIKLQVIHAYYLSIYTNVLIIPYTFVNKDGQQTHKIWYEIFPFSLDEIWLTQDRQNYLRELSNWNKDHQTVLRELDNLNDINIEIVSSIQESKKYNPLHDNIIGQIKQLFRLINNEISSEQEKKMINDLKGELEAYSSNQEIPNLKKYYSVTEFLVVLLILIKKAIIDHHLLFNLLQFADKYPDVFRLYFDQFLESRCPNQKMLLEAFYIWTFQETRFRDEFGIYIESTVSQHIKCVKLKEEDIILVEQIINSQGAWHAIANINSLATEQIDQQLEYIELLQFLRNTKILSFNIQDVKGITLFNGRIGLNKAMIYPYQEMEKQKRGMTVVTLLHETFGHKKRLEYVNWQNVLQGTPDKQLEEVEQVEPAFDEHLEQSPDKHSEAGEYVERETFGEDLEQLTNEQAGYILDPSNWTKDKSKKLIIQEFQALKVLPKTEKSNENNRQTLKAYNYKSPVRGWCPLQKRKPLLRIKK